MCVQYKCLNMQRCNYNRNVGGRTKRTCVHAFFDYPYIQITGFRRTFIQFSI
jgi:hypothetical protein